MLIAVCITTVVLLLATFLYTRTNPFASNRCPNCEVPYLVIPARESGAGGYEVLICPQCTNTNTRVHGHPSRFGYCPACNQRTLETPVRRLDPTPTTPLQVEVEERCHVCGFEDTIQFPRAPISRPRTGKVIPFKRKG